MIFWEWLKFLFLIFWICSLIFYDLFWSEPCPLTFDQIYDPFLEGIIGVILHPEYVNKIPFSKCLHGLFFAYLVEVACWFFFAFAFSYIYFEFYVLRFSFLSPKCKWLYQSGLP